MSSLPANKIITNKKKGFQNKTLDLLGFFVFTLLCQSEISTTMRQLNDIYLDIQLHAAKSVNHSHKAKAVMVYCVRRYTKRSHFQKHKNFFYCQAIFTCLIKPRDFYIF